MTKLHLNDKVYDLLEQSQSKDFRYRFKGFELFEKDTFMYVEFINAEYCLLVDVLVRRWDKLNGMLRTKGVAYPKELFDLKWQIIEEKGIRKVLYMDMHKIID